MACVLQQYWGADTQMFTDDVLHNVFNSVLTVGDCDVASKFPSHRDACDPLPVFIPGRDAELYSHSDNMFLVQSSATQYRSWTYDITNEPVEDIDFEVHSETGSAVMDLC